MLKQPITVLAQSQVGGPGGIKLEAGKVYTLEDSPYVRVLVKSGTVSLVDPPSLDPVFLEKAGYELRDGYSYPAQPVVETLVKKAPKKGVKISEEQVSYETEDPKENIVSEDNISNGVSGVSGTLDVAYSEAKEDEVLEEGHPEAGDPGATGDYPSEITGM